MNLIAYGVGTQMQYVMVASAGQSDSIMQHAAGGEICQILMSRMEETGAPAAAGKDENRPKKSRSIFYFLPFVFVFVGSRFRIYGNGKGFFPSVFNLTGSKISEFLGCEYCSLIGSNGLRNSKMINIMLLDKINHTL